MLVSEVFYSIQGEGLLAGVPSVFIRTSGCNLRCRWCDTPYASWNPEGEKSSVEDIVAHVRQHPAEHVVITGGEPMVAAEIHDLAGQLAQSDYHITIETAGTVAPEGIACDLASLSPKLADSTPPSDQFGEGWAKRHEERRINLEALSAWAATYSCQFKFVVSDPREIGEIEDLLAQISPTPDRNQVLLMPEGTDSKTLHARGKEITELCKRTGYRFCPRLHIDLFGNTRDT